jgi:uncharacterized membrane protein YkvA (DUF1232 family)
MPPRKRAASDARPSAARRARAESSSAAEERVTSSEGTRRGAARKAAAKTAAPKKAAAKKTPAAATKTAKASPRSTAAKRTTGSKTTAAKSPAASATRAPRSRVTAAANGNGNGYATGTTAQSKTVQDYNEAKRALSALWEDVTKQTYSAFNSIAGRAEKNFNEARQSINEMDVRYALEKTGAKLRAVTKSGQRSVQQMARQARLLYTMLKDVIAGRFKVPWATVSAATAALLYFISPIDLLPDFIPGAGLIDDALVIAMAISLARMDLRRYVDEHHLNAAEYGLKS